ncbi:MAG TPA: cytochrome c peroxidase [Kofleriaceae bacterium]
MACGDGKPATPDSNTTPVDSAPMVDAPPDILSAADLVALGMQSPLPAVPADPTNAYADSAAAARLGQMLFFDKSYSGALVVADDGTNGGLGIVGDTGKVSCASCHAVGSDSLDDRRSSPNNVSLGTSFGTRNALGVVNASFYTWTNWGGRFDSQWSLPLAVAENGAIMNSTRLGVAHMLYAKYRTEYNAVFPVALDADLDPGSATASRFPPSGKPGQTTWDTGVADADKPIINRIYANYGKAIAAYMRTIVSRDAPFDRFLAGDKTAISISAQRGAKLFLTKGCVGCHSGPDFTDNEFHALVVAQTGAHVPATDNGRFQDVPPLLTSAFNVNGAYSDDTNTHKLDGLAQADTQKGQFRTKSLRNIAGAGPYMHSGQLATLEDVVEFYNQGGGDPGSSGITKDTRLMSLNLGSVDKADLVEFMKTLSGEPLAPALIVDISK